MHVFSASRCLLHVDMLCVADFLEYCCAVFNEKAGELDGGLCRLALFLDPRYKDTAVPVGSADSLISKVCFPVQCACPFWHDMSCMPSASV